MAPGPDEAEFCGEVTGPLMAPGPDEAEFCGEITGPFAGSRFRGAFAVGPRSSLRITEPWENFLTYSQKFFSVCRDWVPWSMLGT